MPGLRTDADYHKAVLIKSYATNVRFADAMLDLVCATDFGKYVKMAKAINLDRCADKVYLPKIVNSLRTDGITYNDFAEEIHRIASEVFM